MKELLIAIVSVGLIAGAMSFAGLGILSFCYVLEAISKFIKARFGKEDER